MIMQLRKSTTLHVSSVSWGSALQPEIRDKTTTPSKRKPHLTSTADRNVQSICTVRNHLLTTVSMQQALENLQWHLHKDSIMIIIWKLFE